jgi:hypothetical protein
MKNRKPPQARVSKKRDVHTYAELWHGSRVLLERAQAGPKGSKWLWMGSLLLAAFSFEAYLNHIGPEVFECWDAIEVLSPEGKLDMICESLGIVFFKDERPRQTVHELIKFRNNLAHGKTVTVEENTNRDVDQYLDEFIGIRPLAIWEGYCTEKNAIRTRDDVEKILRLIHEKVTMGKELLFGFGIYTASASLDQ